MRITLNILQWPGAGTRILTIRKRAVLGVELHPDPTDPANTRFGVHVEGFSGWVLVDAESYKAACEALNAD